MWNLSLRYTLRGKGGSTPGRKNVEREVDPSDYSMNPEVAIASEEFEGDDANIKNWGGGSTDFSFIDENDNLPVESQILRIPESEEIETD